MCGILGQIKLTSEITRDKNKFRQALNLMTHRGPDDSGILADDNFIFGHRRLSIIDVSSRARQPMVSSDGNAVLIFNGEIYNYSELKEDLLKKGYSFSTTSDTEVLLNGYRCHGMQFIDRCIGMFAFAIYDKTINTCFLARDRIGIKPLFFTSCNGRLSFSSEIKSILAYENIEKHLNLDAVSSYLSFRYPILDDTFFENIHSLPPGHYLKIHDGNVERIKYWDPVDQVVEKQEDRGENFFLKKLQELLESSVQYRMISDVPIGALLSGGIDSTIITSIMARRSEHVNTFTIGYDEEGYNEFAYAAMAADKYNTNHHEMHSNADSYFHYLKKLIACKDAPLSIPNEATQFEMALEIKKNVTVILAGTGADELFHGYGRIYRSTSDFHRMKNIDQFEGTARATFMNNYKNQYGDKVYANEADHFLGVYGYTGLDLKKELLSPDIDLDTIENKFSDKFQNYFNRVSKGTYLDRMGYLFLKVHIPGILHHNDVSSMAASVELRVPYLDHRLVEFALSVPDDYKMKWNNLQSKEKSKHLMSDKISEIHDTPKYILRKAYKTSIPPGIYNRKKMGFPVPLHAWFGKKSRGVVSNILLSKTARQRGIYNISMIENIIKGSALEFHKGDSRTYQNSLAGKIWMLMNLEVFLSNYF